MRKLFITCLALCLTLSASAIKVYINPGHGTWGSEDRNMRTINYGYGDTLGFWESNTNLWKALYMEAKLKSAGYTVAMSRRKNGTTASLATIRTEAENSGSSYFISIHSNAGPEGVVGGSSGNFANYPVMLYRGYTGSPSLTNSDKMAKASAKRLYEAFWTTPASAGGTGKDGGPEFTTYYSPTNLDVVGCMSFYGYNLGVIPSWGVPGFLAEGYFHTYSPARHRALNPDWCRQEGLRYARGVKDYFGTGGEKVGYIMGYVRSKTETFTHTYYVPYYASNDKYKPINGAKVYLTNSSGQIVRTNCYRYVKRELKNQEYYTTDHNYNGIFVYDDLAPGTYTITVKATGYKTYTQTVTVTADKTTYPEIFLTPGKDPDPIRNLNLNPYAYKLSSELSADNKNITVHFYLNNLAATVKVIFNDGKKDYVARSYTDVKAGGYSSTIAIDTMPKGVPLTWRVDVTGYGLVTPVKSDKEYYFYHPTSVDVDDNPQSPYFGRILCNEGYHEIKSKSAALVGASGETYDTYKSYTLGAGLYEFDPLFNFVKGYNGGHTFTTNRIDRTDAKAVTPHRIRIADDGRIFLTSFNGGSSWTGKAIWTLKPEDLNTWTPGFWYNQIASNSELQNTVGEYIGAPNVGFDVQGAGDSLRVLVLSATTECYDGSDAAYRCYEYNWGTKPAWNIAATKKWFDCATSTYKVNNHSGSQVQFDNHGGIWVCQYQQTMSEKYPSLIYYDKDGVCRYHEVMNNRSGGGFRFNKDFTRVIISGGNGATGEATVYTVSNDANGYPTKLTKEYTIPMGLGTGMCDFAWDYADNVYAVCYGAEKIVAYALPYSSKRVIATPAADKYTFTLAGTPDTTPEPEPEPKPEGVTAEGMNPFAYNLSSALNEDGSVLTVNYSLNADAADVKVVVSSDNQDIATVACEGKTRGSYTVEIPATTFPKNTTITWRVDVTGAVFKDPTCIDNTIRFVYPTSIDIDNNPENENFGTVFCVEGRQDAKNNFTYSYCLSYTDGAGLYLINADGTPRTLPNQTKIRYGYNGGSGRISQSKQYFHESKHETLSPNRVRVSDDGRVFISSMGIDGQILWEADPLVFSRPDASDWSSRTGWSRVMAEQNSNTYMATEKRSCSHTYCGIYSIYTDDTKKFLAGPNVGFDVQGSGKDLKLLMLSGCKDAIVTGTALHYYCSEYDLGNAKSWTAVPSREYFRGHILGYLGTQVQYGKDGNVWMGQQKSGTDAANLMKFNADGTVAYQSDAQSPFSHCGAMRFNKDFTKVVITSKNKDGKTGYVVVYPVGEDGMPVWSEGLEINMTAIGTDHTDFAWDYADNLYVLSSTGKCVAVYAMPRTDLTVSTPAASRYAISTAYAVTWNNIFLNGQDVADETKDLTNAEPPVLTDYTGTNNRLWRLVQVGFNRYLIANGKTAVKEGNNGEGTGLPMYVKEFFTAADDASVVNFFASDAKFAWLGEYIAQVANVKLDTREKCAQYADDFINRKGAFVEKGKPAYWRPAFAQAVWGLASKMGPNDYMPVKWNWELDEEKYLDNYWVSYWNVTNHDADWYQTNGYEYASVPSNWYNFNTVRDTKDMTEDEMRKWGGNGLACGEYVLAWRSDSVAGDIVHHVENNNAHLYATYVEKRLQENDQTPDLTANPHDATNDDVLHLLANDNYAATKHDNIKMERTLKGGVYNTICLPFSFSDEAQLPAELRNAEVKQLTGVVTSYDGDNQPIAALEFAKIASPVDMKPGVPYLIKPEKDIDVEYIVFNQLTEANIYEDGPLSESQEGVTFQGVYNPTVLPADALVLDDANRLVQVADAAEVIKGYRGYFVVTDPVLSNLASEGRLFFSLDQSTPTGIASPESNVLQVSKIFHNGRLYILRDTTIYDVLGIEMK